MSPGFPEGAGMRYLALYGESVTLENPDRSVDESSDWNDVSETTTTVTVEAFIQSAGTGDRIRTAEDVNVDADATMYVADDDLGTFGFADGGEPTVVTDAEGDKWTVLHSHLDPAGVHEVLLRRR